MNPLKPLPTEKLAKKHIPTDESPISSAPDHTTCPDGHPLPCENQPRPVQG